jgi:hypothetical protein
MYQVLGRGEVHTGFDGEPVRKRPVERPCRRWEDDFKMDF